MSDIILLEGTVHVDSVADFLKKIDLKGCSVTFLDADYVVDREHAEFAARKALKSWTEGRNVARTLAMEVLLYAAATRQISKATEMGLKEGKNRVVVVIIGDKSCVEELKKRIDFVEEKVLELTDEKIKRLTEFFEISKDEIEIVGLEKIPLLVRERISLYDISK